MQWLAAISVKRPVFASVLIIALTVVGAFSFTKLGLDRFPKVDFPTVVVTTRLPGAAPEEVETEITDKIEEAVNTISGIDELRSTSSEGVSMVIVAFLLEKDADVAAQEVRDRVNRVLPLLPRTIDQPTVEKFDPDSAPVLTLALSAKKPIRDITEYADKKLRRQLESVSGVGQVVVVGGRAAPGEHLARRRPPARLQPHRHRRVARAADAERRDPRRPRRAGRHRDDAADARPRRLRRRVRQHRRQASATARHPAQGRRPLEDGMAEAETKAALDGEPTVLLTVRRQSGTNTVQVVDAVKERLAEVTPLLPAGYEVRVVRDLSEFIRASIASVEEHLIFGSILAAAVVLVFLWNWRSTFIAAVAIPTSIIATFGLIWQQGFTLNSMTMLALTLAVGIVIDDAIVVLENIYRFVEEKGMAPMQAAIEATREIGLAVLATTLSLIAIFVPVGFMGGIVGRFMTSFGLTMSFAILVSLLVSFTLTPMMAARWIKMRPRDRGRRAGHAARRTRRFFRPLDAGYTTVLTLVARASLGDRRPRGARPAEQRSALHGGEQELPARRRPVRVRGQPPGGRGHAASRRPRSSRTAIAARVRQIPEVEFTLVSVADDPARTQNLGTDLRAAEAGRRARSRPVRGHERGARFVLPQVGVANLRTGVRAGRDVRRRRQPERRDPVHDQRSGPQASSSGSATAVAEPRRGSSRRLVDVDTSLNVGKPELRCTSTA